MEVLFSNEITIKSENNAELAFKCRICLEQGNIPIYSGNSESELNENVCIFGDIEIRQYDPYPKYLCEFCFSDLQTAVEFRRRAKKTDRILKHNLYSLGSITGNREKFNESCSVENEQFVPKPDDGDTHPSEDKLSIHDRREQIISCSLQTSQQVLSADNNNKDSVNSLKYKFNTTEAKTAVQSDQMILMESRKDDYPIHDEALHFEQSMIKCEIQPYDANNPQVLNKDVHSGSNEIKLVLECEQESVKSEKLANILDPQNNEQRKGGFKKDSLLPSIYMKYFKTTSHKKFVECVLCNKIIQNNSRKEHYALHDPNSASRYQCGECGKVFRQRNGYNHHKKKGHSKDNQNNIRRKKKTEFQKNDTIKDSLLPSVYMKHFKPTGYNNLVQCQCCNKTVHKNSRKEHYALHDPNSASRFKCELCGKTFRQKNVYNSHKRKLHSNDVSLTFKCKMCSYEGSSEAQINLHMRAHSEKKYVCNFCPRKFQHRHYLLSHKLTHEDNENLKQNSLPCDKYFKQIENVNNQQMVQCQICDKTMQKASRRSHYEALHAQNPKSKYLCDVCGKSFYMINNYLNHKSTHSNEFPFKCMICPYRGRNSGLLKSHMRVHSDQSYYRCDICSKHFNYKSNLIRHIRRHYNQPTYKCEVCNKGFHEKFALTRHFKIRHLGEIKPHACEFCDKVYANRKNLLGHQNKKHDRKKGRRADYKMAEVQYKKEG